MRTTRRGWLGIGLIVVWIGALVAVVVVSADDHGRVDRSAGSDAASRFVDAWERSREATFLTIGTFERHSEVTGASIGSEDVVAQRPPGRLHRQLGGVDGRIDDRMIVCPAGPAGAEEAPCQLGAAGGPTYAEDVADEVAGLRTLVEGPDAVYSVRLDEEGCFVLTQERIAPRAPFGTRARYCFDAETGAPIDIEVAYAGGIEERTIVRTVRSEVSDADLRP